MFDLNKYNQKEFSELWPWVQDLIKKSAEMQNSSKNSIQDDDLSDIPF
jgi:hypothetical protein